MPLGQVDAHVYLIPILWWDDGFGGVAAIMASIDGSGSSYPIGEVDNASRVIKYVGILGYRYSSYNLVDMRLHDINIIADLNEDNPLSSIPPPTQDQGSIPYDGTTEGISEGLPPDIGITLPAFEEVVDSISVWWTGWYPTLHFRYEGASTDGPNLVIQFGWPLGRPAPTIEEASFLMGIPNDPTGTTEYQEQNQDNTALLLFKTWGVKVSMWVTGWATGKVCAATSVNPALWTFALTGILLYLSLFFIDLGTTINTVLETFTNPIDRFVTILTQGIISLFGYLMLDFFWAAWQSTGFIAAIKARCIDWRTYLFDLTDMSAMFIWIKLGLIIIVFITACYIGGFSTLGLM